MGQQEEQKIYNFLCGLREDIRRCLFVVNCTTFRELVDHAINAEFELNACEERDVGKHKIAGVQAHGDSYKKQHKNHQGEKQKSNYPCPHCVKKYSEYCNLTTDKSLIAITWSIKLRIVL